MESKPIQETIFLDAYPIFSLHANKFSSFIQPNIHQAAIYLLYSFSSQRKFLTVLLMHILHFLRCANILTQGYLGFSTFIVNKF